MAYQAIGYDKRGGIMHVWDDELGHQKFPFKPYGYLPNENGQYQTFEFWTICSIFPTEFERGD